MGKYFDLKDGKNEDPTYPDDVKILREKLEKYGKVKCNNYKLGQLWRDFSDELYSASFLLIDDDFVKEFADWLDNINDD